MSRIDMNPEELNRLCYESFELLESTKNSFNKINSSFEQTINSVKAGNVDTNLVKIYETIKGIQTSFNASSMKLSEFLDNQLINYNKFSNDVAEAVGKVDDAINFN